MPAGTATPGKVSITDVSCPLSFGRTVHDSTTRLVSCLRTETVIAQLRFFGPSTNSWQLRIQLSKLMVSVFWAAGASAAGWGACACAAGAAGGAGAFCLAWAICPG